MHKADFVPLPSNSSKYPGRNNSLFFRHLSQILVFGNKNKFDGIIQSVLGSYVCIGSDFEV